MRLCKSGHEFDGLACASCLTDKSTQIQRDLAGDFIRARKFAAHTDGNHYSLGREDWQSLFKQYGWSHADAQVPTLCGVTMPLRDLDAKKKVDECKCVACVMRLRELSS